MARQSALHLEEALVMSPGLTCPEIDLGEEMLCRQLSSSKLYARLADLSTCHMKVVAFETCVQYYSDVGGM